MSDVTRTLTTGSETQTEIWYAGHTEAEKAVGEHVGAPSETSVVAEQAVQEAA